MKASEVIKRARSQVGLHTIYELGHGGMRPDLPTAADGEQKCDCTGFLAWSMGMSRKTDDPWYAAQSGGWMSSAAIFRDCGTTKGFYDAVEWNKARPGMILVFHAVPFGHVGIVTELDSDGAPSKAIHCSHGNYRSLGDAIAETPVLIFKANGALLAERAGMEFDL